MKKVLALLFCTVLILSTCGFTSLANITAKSDPIWLYTSAAKKTAALQDRQARYNVGLNFHMGESGLELKTESFIQMKHADGNYTVAARNVLSSLGEKQESACYYKDGYFYLRDKGSKTKFKGEYEKYIEKVTELALADIDEESFLLGSESADAYLVDPVLTKSGDNLVVSYQFNTGKMQSFFNEIMGESGNPFKNSIIQVNSASGTATIDKQGYLIGESLKCAYSVPLGANHRISGKMNVSAKYIDPGVDFTISFPSDLAEYKDITDQME